MSEVEAARPAPRVLKKGDDVWMVSDTLHSNLYRDGPPRLVVRHGTIMGGGDFYVLVRWERADGTLNRTIREQRRPLQELVSATKAEALARYRSYLPGRIESARREVDKLLDLELLAKKAAEAT
jgi:hypothetical protein